MTERYQIEICDDCLVYLANGDVPESRPDLALEIAENWPGFDIWPDSSESFFSWSRCECCEALPGGNRTNATAVERKRESSHA